VRTDARALPRLLRSKGFQEFHMLAEVRAVSTPMLSDEFFLARQPILGRDQRLVAYELLFRAAGEHDDARLTNGAAATAAVISHASQLGLEQVVGNKLAFVNVDDDVLMADYVRFLPPNKVILEILETVKPTEPLLARVAELKELGFKFALDDVVNHSDEVDQLLGLVDVVKIDLQGVTPEALGHLCASLRKSGKKLLAEKVETQQEFRLCQELGFDYFQGYYFARPVILSGRKITPSEMVILHLLQLINSDADDATIETAVKRDPLISLNLLRLVNSRAAGPRGRIESVAEALARLGRKQLRRWLQILMFAAPGSQVELNSPLLQLATTRGKLLELMSLQVNAEDVTGAERAFTVGIMSLADALFSMPMADILDNVELADDVRAALLERAGELGAMLEVVERLEKADTGSQFTAALRRLGLTSKQVREIELAAFDWVSELVHDAA
jgi:EAL and modified HD-GYP domain-containing signal transduction protein